MTNKSFRNELAGYYSEQSLPAGSAERLVALARVGRPPGRPIPTRRTLLSWGQLVGRTAACLALLSVGVFLGRSMEQPAVTEPMVEHGSNNPPKFVESAESALGRNGPRFVAVNFHIDGCPLSAATANAFAELETKYAEKPLLFARYDMTSSARRDQSQKLASCLDIGWIYEGSFQSGMIKLIDRKTGKVLATMTDRKQLEEMECALNRCFD